jgi:hypothetical protein
MEFMYGSLLLKRDLKKSSDNLKIYEQKNTDKQ